MRKRNLQPTVLTIKKPYKAIYAENGVEAVLKALDYFTIDCLGTVDKLNDLSEHGLILDNGSEVTAYIDTELITRSVTQDSLGNHCYWVDVVIVFNYFSTEYCTSTQIIRLFDQLFPEFKFSMFSTDSYQVESYHI